MIFIFLSIKPYVSWLHIYLMPFGWMNYNEMKLLFLLFLAVFLFLTVLYVHQAKSIPILQMFVIIPRDLLKACGNMHSLMFVCEKNREDCTRDVASLFLSPSPIPLPLFPTNFFLDWFSRFLITILMICRCWFILRIFTEGLHSFWKWWVLGYVSFSLSSSPKIFPSWSMVQLLFWFAAMFQFCLAISTLWISLLHFHESLNLNKLRNYRKLWMHYNLTLLLSVVVETHFEHGANCLVIGRDSKSYRQIFWLVHSGDLSIFIFLMCLLHLSHLYDPWTSKYRF